MSCRSDPVSVSSRTLVFPFLRFVTSSRRVSTIRPVTISTTFSRSILMMFPELKSMSIRWFASMARFLKRTGGRSIFRSASEMMTEINPSSDTPLATTPASDSLSTRATGIGEPDLIIESRTLVSTSTNCDAADMFESMTIGFECITRLNAGSHPSSFRNRTLLSSEFRVVTGRVSPQYRHAFRSGPFCLRQRGHATNSLGSNPTGSSIIRRLDVIASSRAHFCDFSIRTSDLLDRRRRRMQTVPTADPDYQARSFRQAIFFIIILFDRKNLDKDPFSTDLLTIDRIAAKLPPRG